MRFLNSSFEKEFTRWVIRVSFGNSSKLSQVSDSGDCLV